MAYLYSAIAVTFSEDPLCLDVDRKTKEIYVQIYIKTYLYSIFYWFPVVTLSPTDPKQQTSVYSQQPSSYPQQSIGYPQQPIGYQQQQTGYSQQHTGYPQLPIIYNDQVGDADAEVSNAFSVPQTAPGRPMAKPPIQNTASLNGKI